MLAHLIKKEFLENLLNQRFIILAIFSIVLMPLSAWINYAYYSARKTSFDSQFAEHVAQQENTGAMRAYRNPSLLSSLARGNEPYMPIYFSFSSTAEGNQADATTPGNIEAQDFAILSTFGSFDYLFLVQVVFSLLAILLAFDMVAGEKERGTLKALLANPLPRDKLMLAKFAGGYGLLWMTFLVGFLLLYLVLVLFDSQFTEAVALSRVGFIFFFSSLFIACFFSLGLMVSTFCHTSRTAIIVLLVVWVVMQLVIPKSGEMLAVVLKPARSEHEVRAERQQIIAEELASLDDDAGVTFYEITGIDAPEKAFRMIQTDAPGIAAFRTAYQSLFAGSKQQQNNRIRMVTQAWERERAVQRTIGNSIALLSPASALTMVVSDAAGTGDLAYQNYRNAVADQYQIVDREYFSKMESNRYRINISGMMLSGNFGEDAATPDAIPPFTITEPDLASVLNANLGALATLCFYLIAPFLVGYFRFLRYDVR